MLRKYKIAAVQAAPVFMNLDATVEKSIHFIEEAAANKASLIGFPECWIPGYPWWIWLDCPMDGLHFVQDYHQNSLSRDDQQLQDICDAARDNNIFVVIGASERAQGSLYISQFFINQDGTLLDCRRKLKPTHVERTLYGDGYGHNLKVYETDLGRVGGLCCWEHLQPLSKYAMYSQNEQVHIGAWPSFNLYPGKAYSLGAELNMAVSSVYAAEGQCYFLAPCGVISEAMVELMANTPQKRDLLKTGGGHAMIFAPDGSRMCEYLDNTEEGLLYADIDLGVISVAKSFADPSGHYSRPDVTRLILNTSPIAPMEIVCSPGAIDEGSGRQEDDTEAENVSGATRT